MSLDLPPQPVPFQASSSPSPSPSSTSRAASLDYLIALALAALNRAIAVVEQYPLTTLALLAATTLVASYSLLQRLLLNLFILLGGIVLFAWTTALSARLWPSRPRRGHALAHPSLQPSRPPQNPDDPGTASRIRAPNFTRPRSWLDYELGRAKESAPFRAAPLVESRRVQRALDDILAFISRDYIRAWYIPSISPEMAFVARVDAALHFALAALKQRAERVDYVHLIAARAIPLLTSHVTEYRRAERLVKGDRLQRSLTESHETDCQLAKCYRDGKLHAAVSPNPTPTLPLELAYLRKRVDRFLPLLIPRSESRSRILVILVREIVVCRVLQPLLDSISDPDYWNSTIDMLTDSMIQQEQTLLKKIREALEKQNALERMEEDAPSEPLPRPRTYDEFIKLIKDCHNLLDALSIRDKILTEIHKKQTEIERVTSGTESDPSEIINGNRVAEIKTYISKLRSAQKSIEKRIAALGGGIKSVNAIPIVRKGPKDLKKAPPKHSLLSILEDPHLLSYFTEFMDQEGRTKYLQFWMIVEGIRAQPSSSTDELSEDASGPRAADVARICKDYFGREATMRIDVSGAVLLRIEALERRLDGGEPLSDDAFECIFDAQQEVFHAMEHEDIVNFKRSGLFMKMAAHLALDRSPRRGPVPPGRGEEVAGDGLSLLPPPAVAPGLGVVSAGGGGDDRDQEEGASAGVSGFASTKKSLIDVFKRKPSRGAQSSRAEPPSLDLPGLPGLNSSTAPPHSIRASLSPEADGTTGGASPSPTTPSPTTSTDEPGFALAPFIKRKLLRASSRSSEMLKVRSVENLAGRVGNLFRGRSRSGETDCVSCDEDGGDGDGSGAEKIPSTPTTPTLRMPFSFKRRAAAPPPVRIEHDSDTSSDQELARYRDRSLSPAPSETSLRGRRISLRKAGSSDALSSRRAASVASSVSTSVSSLSSNEPSLLSVEAITPSGRSASLDRPSGLSIITRRPLSASGLGSHPALDAAGPPAAADSPPGTPLSPVSDIPLPLILLPPTLNPPPSLLSLDDRLAHLASEDADVQIELERASREGLAPDRVRRLHLARMGLGLEMGEVREERSRIVVKELEDLILPDRTTAKIVSHHTATEEGRAFSVYLIQVSRIDPAMPLPPPAPPAPTSGWVVARRFSEFATLHATLRVRFPGVVSGVEFPSRVLDGIMRMRKDFIEGRRVGLERWLQSMLKHAEICRYPDFRAFICHEDILRMLSAELGDATGGSSAQIGAAAAPAPAGKRSFMKNMLQGVDEGFDALLGRGRAASASSTAAGGSGTGTAGDAASRPPAPLKPSNTTSPTPAHSAPAPSLTPSLSAAPTRSDLTSPQDPATQSPTDAILDLLIELFDLREKNNWLRRQAVALVLQQVLGAAVERRVADQVRWLRGDENVAAKLEALRDSMWPNDAPSPPTATPPTRTPSQRRRDAHAKLASLLPELLGGMVGRANARRGAGRLWLVFQNRRLNQHLVYTLADEVLGVLFGEEG
ncbi:PXA domain-containing protein, partial [Blyttiomyces helicus]